MASNNNPGTWLFKNLQNWTPFSVIVLIVSAACAFILIWNTIHGIAIPSFVWGVLAGILGGTGGISAILTGIKTANGVAKDAATAAVQAHTDALKEIVSSDNNTLRNG